MKLKTGKKWIILKGAIKIFAKRGFFRSRTKEIAQTAQVSEGTIYNYFKNKDDLLFEVSNYIWASLVPDLRKKIARIKNPDDQIKEILKDILLLFEQDRELAKVFFHDLKIQNIIQDENVKIEQAKVVEDLLSLIKEVLENGIQIGMYRQNLDVDIMSAAIYGSVEGVINCWLEADEKDQAKFTFDKVNNSMFEAYFRLVR